VKEKTYPFQFAESCMYNYLENVARVEALRDDLKVVDSSTVVQNYGEHTAPDGYTDSVPARMLKIDMLESLIIGLERWTNPITRVITDLESKYNLSPKRQEMLEILKIRYLGGNTWERTIECLKINRRTFIKRREQLVAMVIRYMHI
jgi:hypothetical protein